MNWRSATMIVLLLMITGFCLFEFMLNRQSEAFREYESAVASLQWMLPVCVAIWCGAFLFLTFSLNDLLLIGLLLIAVIAYFNSNSKDALTLLFGVTLGRGTRFLMNEDGKRYLAPTFPASTESGEEAKSSLLLPRYPPLAVFLLGLVLLLAFSTWWHFDMTNNFYRGPRWMGLWNNPNAYGMLMSVGVVLSIGLLTGSVNNEFRLASEGAKWKTEGGRRKLKMVLFIAAGNMAVGLIFSYSRGAWIGTTVGLLYLAKAHGKFKWQFVLPGIFVLATAAWFFWSSTADSDAWYVKRLDLGRPSAQHRVAAWRGALQMMRDYPLGVGWNKAIETYDKNYSPPENGAAAITTNDYMMLGTQLGLPGLFCFVAYVASCFRSRLHLRVSQPQSLFNPARESSRMTCRAAALAMLVAFWFDGGLFKLATAAVFWILLELAYSTDGARVNNCRLNHYEKWNPKS